MHDKASKQDERPPDAKLTGLIMGAGGCLSAQPIVPDGGSISIHSCGFMKLTLIFHWFLAKQAND
ncbi:hypothetical protein, partial [Aeromonas aquatica]|uniref:hypothetical protein n=1 Tax=Aeromonas aquatica TaxID=558964 RepID=UPI00286F8D9E